MAAVTPAPNPGTRRLLIQPADGESRVLLLSDRRVTLGRSRDCDLPFPADPYLSRTHLAIEPEGGNWIVADLDSKNGTMLNGQKLIGRSRLRPGDRIQAGRVALHFEENAPTVAFVLERSAALDDTSLASIRLDEVLNPNVDRAGDARWRTLLAAGAELDTRIPLPELFKTILNLAVKTAGASRGVLMLLEGKDLVVRAAEGAEFRISQSVRDRVINNKESILVCDTGIDSSFNLRASIVAQKIKSLIAVPLQTRDSVIGLLYVDSPEKVLPFSTEDLELLTFLACIAAIRIENARLALVEEAERIIRAELEQAALVQQGLWPKAPPQVPGWEVAGSSIACRSVGGDYYDYVQLPDGRLAIICADVAGKGMPAAILMSSVQARLQALCEVCSDSAELVSRLNTGLLRTCPSNRFVTFFMLCVDPATGSMAYCNAGHNPPFLLRADGTVERLLTGGPPIGILSIARYQSASLTLQPGDRVVMFSDGITEAEVGEQDYGEERMMAAMRASGESANELLRGVLQSVEAFLGSTPANDDMTVVVLRRVG